MIGQPGGLTLWGFLVVLLIAGIVIGIIVLLYYKAKSRKANVVNTQGKLLCEFCSPEGAYEEVCDVYKGLIKKIQDKSRATFTVENFIKAPKKADQSIDVYFVLQDHCFPILYPAGKPRDEQVMIMKTHYLVNDPIPKITYKPEYWTEERYKTASSAIMKLALNEKSLQVLTSFMSGVFGNITEMLKSVSKIPLIFYIVLLNTLILAYVAYTTTTGKTIDTNILKFLTGFK